MSLKSNKHSVMTLFSHQNSIYSHLVRLVMAEKSIDGDIVEIESSKICEDLIEYNPYGIIPTLVDRDLVVYTPSIIVEYLDERFPHPPLMPVFPVARAETRLFIYRIVEDWYSLADRLVLDPNDSAARKDLHDTLISSSEAVSGSIFFMNDEFSILDCYVAPLLWRLPEFQIELEGIAGKHWKRYMNNVFSRNTFKSSLTHEETYRRTQILGD